MVTRIGTTQRKTRHKYAHSSYRNKGKIPLSKYFQEFSEGDRVNLKIYPNVQVGRFFSRFHGLSGVVSGKKGRCLEVRIKDGNKEKTIIVHPMHLNKH